VQFASTDGCALATSPPALEFSVERSTDDPFVQYLLVSIRPLLAAKIEESLVVTQPFRYLGESDVLPYIGNLNFDSLILFRVGDDHDEAMFDPSNAIALFADVLNLDFPSLTFLDWWFRWLTLGL
jgi:hypothetical protein